MKKDNKLPQYNFIDKKGPEHSPIFTISVKHDDKLHAIGKGKNKQDAEINAAELLLEKLKKENFNCGVILLSGFPNAGKSTLLNCILKEKISIVSHKVQTTKDKISGVMNVDNTINIYRYSGYHKK